MEAYLTRQCSPAPSSSASKPTPSTSSIPFKASRDWPPAKDPSSLKYTTREGNFTFTCVPRSAQKGGVVSRVWRHGIELRRTNTKRPDWLCYLCWDRRRVAIAYTSSSKSKAIDHMAEEHHFDQEGNLIEMLDPQISVLAMWRRASCKNRCTREAGRSECIQ